MSQKDAFEGFVDNPRKKSKKIRVKVDKMLGTIRLHKVQSPISRNISHYNENKRIENHDKQG